MCQYFANYCFNNMSQWKIQVKLHAFRAQWLSELKPSSGGSGTSDRLVRTRGLKKQDTANEEKVSLNGLLLSNFLGSYLHENWLFITSGHRTLLTSCKGRAEWSFLWRYVDLVISNLKRCNRNIGKRHEQKLSVSCEKYNSVVGIFHFFLAHRNNFAWTMCESSTVQVS